MSIQSNIKNQLDLLDKTIEKQELGEFERQNLTRDIEALQKRVVSRAYCHTDYVARDTFDIPRRTKEFLLYLEGYAEQAQLWSKKLLPYIKPNHTVIDLCPGWAPKIELALKQLEFTGTLIMLDVNDQAWHTITTLMRVFGYSYTLKTQRTNLLNVVDTTKADIIVGNHIIDDLLLYQYSHKNKISLQQFYESEEALVSATKAILAEADNYKNEVSSAFANSLEKLSSPGTIIILTHYFGLLESSHNLKEWNLLCQDTIQESIDLLIKNYDYEVLEQTHPGKFSSEILLRAIE